MWESKAGCGCGGSTTSIAQKDAWLNKLTAKLWADVGLDLMYLLTLVWPGVMLWACFPAQTASEAGRDLWTWWLNHGAPS